MTINPNIEIRDGACHCGTVRFRTRLADGLRKPRRCNCSICRMRGAVAVSAPLDGFTLVSGEDKLTLYQFNTNSAKHYFCSVCGIYTHHHRRSTPTEFGVNVACLDGVSPFDFAEVPVGNGVQHPSDQHAGKVNLIAGTLKFIPNMD
jgi:hypothetical protein